MSDSEPKTKNPNQNQRPRRPGYHKAVLLSFLALAGGAEAVQADPAAAARASVAIEHLIQLNKLPGSRIKASKEIAQPIMDSTVTIDVRPKGDSDYNETATGKVMAFDGEYYDVETSFHQLAAALPSKFGSPQSLEKGTINVGERQTLDITGMVGDIQIGDPLIKIEGSKASMNADYQKRMNNPLGEVVQAVASAKDKDVVWLKVQPSQPNASGYRSLDQLKPLDLSQNNPNNDSETPTPGQEVIVYSVPADNIFEPIEVKAVFIKRVKVVNPDHSFRYLDYVGFKTEKDAVAAQPGASGSSFAAKVGKNIFVSGGLSDQYPMSDSKALKNFERQTGVDLSHLAAVGRYTVPDSREILQESLSSG